MDISRKKTGFTVHRAIIAAGIAVLMICVVCIASSCGFRTKTDISGNSDYEVLDSVPEWDGDPSIEVNDNKPEFVKKEIKAAGKALKKGKDFRVFTEIDKLGRCGSAVCCIGSETMPTDERGSIGMIQPSGWQLSKYDFVDNGGYLYNRCHLLGWQLSGENDEVRNLITGTRYMNTQGMLPFENKTAEYVRQTGNHVLYRATPIFKGNELVARGVEIEAYSLEDDGDGLSFNVYCYNIQPGVKIDYKTGKNKLDESTLPADASNTYSADASNTDGNAGDSEGSAGDSEGEQNGGSGDSSDKTGPAAVYPDLDIPEGVTYILNKNTMRFHKLDCEGAKTIREHNREWFYGTREEAIDKGFVPCGMCKP